MTPDDLRKRFDALVDTPFEPPQPGAGRTMTRFAELWAVAHDDLSLARLAEAHADALAILHERGRTPIPGARYAVWASEAPGRRLSADLDAGGWRLSGAKRFCSGLGHVTHALVTADTPNTSDTPNDTTLFEIPVRAAGTAARIDPSGWSTEAFAATLTGTLHLDNLHLPSTAAVGGPGWYVHRPGFWHGAIGVAACWAGGAAALVSAHDQLDIRDAHRAAHAGAMRADVWEMRAALECAAADIDRDPLDEARAGMARALAARFVIERAASDVLRRFGASAGPAPRAFDAAIARRCAELQLYLLQSHAERDLEALGRDADRSLIAPPIRRTR
jgi:alkylation response protein AidB-like acyl-CoA dehydrogenase